MRMSTIDYIVSYAMMTVWIGIVCALLTLAASVIPDIFDRNYPLWRRTAALAVTCVLTAVAVILLLLPFTSRR